VSDFSVGTWNTLLIAPNINKGENNHFCNLGFACFALRSLKFQKVTISCNHTVFLVFCKNTSSNSSFKSSNKGKENSLQKTIHQQLHALELKEPNLI